MFKKFTPFIIAAMCLLTLQASAQDSRLIAYRTLQYNNGWQPYDSARYVYNPGNNMPTPFSIYGHVIKYDTMYRTGWDGTIYVDSRRYQKTYDWAGYCTENVEYQLYPTVELAKRTVYSYDGNHNMLEELHQDWDGNAWMNLDRVVRTFDGNNNMLTINSEYWNVNTWGSSYLSIYTYDGNNNMLTAVSANHGTQTTVYDSTSRTQYFVNTGNKVDSSHSFIWNSGWVPSNRTYHYFNQNFTEIGWMYKNWDGTNWVNGGQGFNTLNGDDFVIKDSIQMWNSTTSVWENYYRDLYLLDGNNNRTEYRYEMWSTVNNAWKNQRIDTTTFNAHNQPTWYKSYTWDDVNMAWSHVYNDQEWHYYYEPYTANSVAGINKNAGTLLLYPVPARNNLNINLQWNKAEDFTIGIYDIQGRLIRQYGEKASKSLTKNIPLNGLANGTYILKVRGKDATVQEQFVIMD